MRECVYFYCIFTKRERERERNVEPRERTVSNRVSEAEHFWHVYTPVSYQLEALVNGQSEIPDLLKS